jgi:hypothetical protein
MGAPYIYDISHLRVKKIKRILENKSGSTRSHCVENSLSKGLWTSYWMTLRKQGDILN